MSSTEASSDASQQTAPNCRICLSPTLSDSQQTTNCDSSCIPPVSTAQPSDSLVSPCSCTGSMRFVHLGCLQNWLRYRSHQTSASQELTNSGDGHEECYRIFRIVNQRCEVCKGRYKLRYLLRNWRKWKMPTLTSWEKLWLQIIGTSVVFLLFDARSLFRTPKFETFEPLNNPKSMFISRFLYGLLAGVCLAHSVGRQIYHLRSIFIRWYLANVDLQCIQ
eukprot:TRINITY_DN11717_c0_g1_i1.p1 TRINITY_DN11717_c0_g1~~TRINITY_DN11717_c0_g1_i1.p1  ORF type:complete len:220 (-),score=40.34 TRINITY_DN11717_c0_g1_i1:65-724(-)